MAGRLAVPGLPNRSAMTYLVSVVYSKRNEVARGGFVTGSARSVRSPYQLMPVDSSYERRFADALDHILVLERQWGVAAFRPLCPLFPDMNSIPDFVLEVPGIKRILVVEVIGLDSTHYLATKAGQEQTYRAKGCEYVAVDARDWGKSNRAFHTEVHAFRGKVAEWRHRVLRRRY